MNLALTVSGSIFQMLLMMLVGFVGAKTGLIEKKANASLNNIVLFIVNSAMIFMAFQIDYKMDLLRGLGLCFVLAFLTMLLLIPFARMLIRPRTGCDNIVERYAFVYGNCGFVGIPLISATLGAEGVFYTAAYIAAFNILTWTHGVMLMGGKRLSLRKSLRSLISPVMIATLLGLFFFVFRLPIPRLLGEPLRLIAAMNSPLAMLLAGINLAWTPMGEALRSPRHYLVSAGCLLAAPLFVLLLLRVVKQLFFVDPMILTTVALLTACPASANTVMFSLRFGRDHHYGTQIFTLTTVLGAFTIPAVAWLAGRLF